MVTDVELATRRRPDGFLNWLGGVAPTPRDVVQRLKEQVLLDPVGGLRR